MRQNPKLKAPESLGNVRTFCDASGSRQDQVALRTDSGEIPLCTYQASIGSDCEVGVRIRGTLGDIDPLNKVPFKRARSRG